MTTATARVTARTGSRSRVTDIVGIAWAVSITFSAAATDDRGGTRYVTQEVLLTNAPLHILQLGGVRTNAFKICMLGETGSNYVLLATTNLATPLPSWTSLGLMENTNGIWRHLDTGTITNRPMRFYRALQQ